MCINCSCRIGLRQHGGGGLLLGEGVRVGVLRSSPMAMMWEWLRKDNSRLRGSSPAELSSGGKGDTSQSKPKGQGGLKAEQESFLSH